MLLNTNCMKKGLLFLLLISCSIGSKAQTIALIRHDSGMLEGGYVLFAPMQNDITYLVDPCDEEVHQWSSSFTPGLAVYILPDGTLLRTGYTHDKYFNAGGAGGVIQEIDWDSHVKWQYYISDSTQCQHHDVKIMPNGNILVIAWEKKTIAQAKAAGRDTLDLPLPNTGFWCEKILELHPVDSVHATIVWQWHLWDHLVQNFDSTQNNYGDVTNPKLLNINYRAGKSADWFHMNSIDYNPALDQIVVSSRNLDEFYIIDHSTTTAEAASHSGGKYGKGGDFLYRWGNPQAYDPSAPLAMHAIFGQHDVNWIPAGMPNAGDILLFNNGNGRPAGNYSTADRVVLPDSDGTGVYYTPSPYYGPSSSKVVYEDSIPTDFYSSNLGSAQQLINGNVLVCSGTTGDFVEADSAQHKVWEYINPVNSSGPMTQYTTPSGNGVFRCAFYPDTSTAFSSHTMTPIAPIEINPIAYNCSSPGGIITLTQNYNFSISPNPADRDVRINTNLKEFKVLITNTMGEIMYEAESVKSINITGMPLGIYFVTIKASNYINTCKLVIIR